MPLTDQRLTLRLDMEAAAMLRQLAQARELAKSELIRTLIRQAYQKDLKRLRASSGIDLAANLKTLTKSGTRSSPRASKARTRGRKAPPTKASKSGKGTRSKS